MTKELKPHDRTRRVMVGGVPVGGGAPVAVQERRLAFSSQLLNSPMTATERTSGAQTAKW